jgi:molybdopterin-guanine dinucleotide biosynthesis protein A
MRLWRQSRRDHGEEEDGSVGAEPAWDAIVLAGGNARRLGGVDKPALVIGETSLLEVALAACAGARYRVVVGPQRRTKEPVGWTREDPAGTGPLAALGAGLASLPSGSDVVLVLAADLPSVDAAIVERLRSAVASRDDVDGAVAVDVDGRAQPLLAAYRRRPLDRAIIALGVLRDRPIRELLDCLVVAKITAADAAADIDTPADLARWTRDRDGRP